MSKRKFPQMAASNDADGAEEESKNGTTIAALDASNGRQQQQQRRKTKLPPRWLYCPPMGKVVCQKFLPMKTPLDDSYDHLIEQPKYRFHPDMVFQCPLQGAKPGAKIGLWVDLTNSDNFYRGSQIQKKSGCRFVKMRMVGHAESPSEEQTNEFIRVVDEFFEKSPNDVVVVHCTHGFNRTGFLIAAYLYEKEGLSIEMAVREFAECRPNGIYKQHYLDDLRQRFGDEDDEQIESPGRPLWENGPVTDEEFTLEGTFCPQQSADSMATANGESGSSSSAAPSMSTIASSSTATKNSANSPQFMDGKVPGVQYVEDSNLRRSLQEKPVSVEGPHGNNNIRFLVEEPYMVSWKADGVRYLVLLEGRDRVYAFDRDNNPFLITHLAFVRRRSNPQKHKGQPIGEEEFLCETLVDAEMVIDRVKTPGGEVQDTPRLLIYDLIALLGTSVRDKDFKARFKMIEHELIQPRVAAFGLGRMRREEEPISVRRKDFWPIQETHKLFEPKFQRQLNGCHEIDGLVFQPVNRPYTAGRFDYLLKWKPPELSTIDFRLEIKKVRKFGELPEWSALLHVLHSDVPFATMKATKQLEKYDGKIIECKYVQEHGRGTWEFMRERTDKSHPNAYATAVSVCNTIKHPIHRHDLLHFIAKYLHPHHHQSQPQTTQQ